MIPRPHWLALGLMAPAGWSCCVAAGMRVRTPSGEVAAGSLGVGDRVVSIDVATGREVEGTIVHVRRAIRECVALRWRGGELVCTPDHPLYSPERGDYRPASDWVDGAARILLARTGESLAEVAVDACERFAGVHEVVDLTLAGEPRNFVAAGLVVHNKTPAPEFSGDSVVVVVEEGPTFGLAAAEKGHRFRIRICDGEADFDDINSLQVRATATNAVQPGGAGPMWLAMYVAIDGEAMVFDGEAPGQLDEFVDTWRLTGRSCDPGLVVGFERVDDDPDGTIAVSWEVALGFFEFGVDNDPALTITEE